jgi:hypothetical protein
MPVKELIEELQQGTDENQEVRVLHRTVCCWCNTPDTSVCPIDSVGITNIKSPALIINIED